MDRIVQAGTSPASLDSTLEAARNEMMNEKTPAVSLSHERLKRQTPPIGFPYKITIWAKSNLSTAPPYRLVLLFFDTTLWVYV